MRKWLLLAALLLPVLCFAQTPNDGSWTALQAPMLPAYAKVTFTNASTWVWSGGPSTWYGYPSFTMTVTVSDGKQHQLSLYSIDYDQRGRAMTISEAGPISEVQSLSNFTTGKTTLWQIAGTEVFTFTTVNGPNAVMTTMTFTTSNAPKHSIVISWMPVTGATSYNIYRNSTKFASVTAPPYTDSTVVGGQTYQYSVSSVNAQGESAQSQVTQFGPAAP